MLRNLTGIKHRHKVRNEEIICKTQATVVCYRTKKHKFKFAVYVARDKWDKWSNRVLAWVIYDQKKRRRRPSIKYLDKIRRAVGPD